MTQLSMFPPKAILETPRYYAVFLQQFLHEPPSHDDFQELLRQILNALMNMPWPQVILHIGVAIPDPNLMRDLSFEHDNARFNQLTIAAAEITALLCEFFRKAGLFKNDGTLPYTPLDIYHDIMVLDYVAD